MSLTSIHFWLPHSYPITFTAKFAGHASHLTGQSRFFPLIILQYFFRYDLISRLIIMSLREWVMKRKNPSDTSQVYMILIHKCVIHSSSSVKISMRVLLFLNNPIELVPQARQTQIYNKIISECIRMGAPVSSAGLGTQCMSNRIKFESLIF